MGGTRYDSFHKQVATDVITPPVNLSSFRSQVKLTDIDMERKIGSKLEKSFDGSTEKEDLRTGSNQFEIFPKTLGDNFFHSNMLISKSVMEYKDDFGKKSIQRCQTNEARSNVKFEPLKLFQLDIPYDKSCSKEVNLHTNFRDTSKSRLGGFNLKNNDSIFHKQMLTQQMFNRSMESFQARPDQKTTLMHDSIESSFDSKSQQKFEKDSINQDISKVLVVNENISDKMTNKFKISKRDKSQGYGSSQVSPRNTSKISSTMTIRSGKAVFKQTQYLSKGLASTHNKISELMPSVQEDTPDTLAVNSVADQSLPTQPDLQAIKQAEQTGSCQKCKVWKRINVECRNFSLRCDFEKPKNVFKYLSDLTEIDSLTKTAPNLSLALKQISSCLQVYLNEEVRQLKLTNLTLQNQLKTQDEDCKAAEEKFKRKAQELEELQTKIFGARQEAVFKVIERNEFMKPDQIQQFSIADQVRMKQQWQYSELDKTLTDVDEFMKIEQESSMKIVDIFSEMHKQNIANQRFKSGLEYTFQREANLQSAAVREFMKRNFRLGVDPPVLTLNKGTITSDNMISQQIKGLDRFALFEKETLEKKQEIINDLKLQVAMQFRKIIDLENEIEDYQVTFKEQDQRLKMLAGLDLKYIGNLQNDIVKLESEKRLLEEKNSRTYIELRQAHVDKKKITTDFEEISEQYYVQLEFNKVVTQQIQKLFDKLSLSVQVKESVVKLKTKTDRIANKINTFMAELTGGALFQKIKSVLNDQKKGIMECFELFNGIIKTANLNNKPLLTSVQVHEEVFKEFKDKAFKELSDSLEEKMSQQLKDQKEISDLLQKNMLDYKERALAAEEKLGKLEKNSKQKSEEISKMKKQISELLQEKRNFSRQNTLVKDSSPKKQANSPKLRKSIASSDKTSSIGDKRPSTKEPKSPQLPSKQKQQSTKSRKPSESQFNLKAVDKDETDSLETDGSCQSVRDDDQTMVKGQSNLAAVEEIDTEQRRSEKVDDILIARHQSNVNEIEEAMRNSIYDTGFDVGPSRENAAQVSNSFFDDVPKKQTKREQTQQKNKRMTTKMSLYQGSSVDRQKKLDKLLQEPMGEVTKLQRTNWLLSKNTKNTQTDGHWIKDSEKQTTLVLEKGVQIDMNNYDFQKQSLTSLPATLNRKSLDAEDSYGIYNKKFNPHDTSPSFSYMTSQQPSNRLMAPNYELSKTIPKLQTVIKNISSVSTNQAQAPKQVDTKYVEQKHSTLKVENSFIKQDHDRMLYVSGVNTSQNLKQITITNASATHANDYQLDSKYRTNKSPSFKPMPHHGQHAHYLGQTLEHHHNPLQGHYPEQTIPSQQASKSTKIVYGKLNKTRQIEKPLRDKSVFSINSPNKQHAALLDRPLQQHTDALQHAVAVSQEQREDRTSSVSPEDSRKINQIKSQQQTNSSFHNVIYQSPHQQRQQPSQQLLKVGGTTEYDEESVMLQIQSMKKHQRLANQKLEYNSYELSMKEEDESEMRSAQKILSRRLNSPDFPAENHLQQHSSRIQNQSSDPMTPEQK